MVKRSQEPVRDDPKPAHLYVSVRPSVIKELDAYAKAGARNRARLIGMAIEKGFDLVKEEDKTGPMS